MTAPLDVETLRQEWVGIRRPHVELHVELGMLQAYARAVHEVSPVWFDEDAARAAGFAGVPAVPSFVFTMPYVAAARRPAGPADGPDAITRLLDLLCLPDGLPLHADQSFTFERPVYAGDRLGGAEEVLDLQRTAGERPLWLVFSQTEWRDATGAVVVTATKTVAVRHPRRA